jgi:hypothetical protein
MAPSWVKTCPFNQKSDFTQCSFAYHESVRRVAAHDRERRQTCNNREEPGVALSRFRSKEFNMVKRKNHVQVHPGLGRGRSYPTDLFIGYYHQIEEKKGKRLASN